ncbi:MFS transporter [Phytohabitans kaempferiae]|uniref:MFS transporter n=1 Tax=Phytohabitans kaempferiae TaxID=1620943 RepID=A0ABV6LYZ7_9ACTN
MTGGRSVLRIPEFRRYWAGVLAVQVGSFGTNSAILYHVYAVTGSLTQTGLVGAAQVLALLGVSPFAGALADRLDGRRILLAVYCVMGAVATALALLTVTGRVASWQILAAVVLVTAGTSLDHPTRQAMLPALVGRERLGQAVALINPSREVAVLVGASVAGLLIAVRGPELMYGLAAVLLLVQVAVVAALPARVFARERDRSEPFLKAIARGVGYVRRRTLLWRLMALDLSATVLSAYRVVLPSLAVDVLHVGPQGYGLLAGAPSAGALLASYVGYLTVLRVRRLGWVLVCCAALHALGAILLAQAPVLALALVGAVVIGANDAVATTINHTAVQLDTPDRYRGRVLAFHQMASRGGPAVGNVLVGAAAGALGPVVALSIGGLGSLAVALRFGARPNELRDYRRE